MYVGDCVVKKVTLTVSGLANDNFQPEMTFSTSDEEITDADMSFHDFIYYIADIGLTLFNYRQRC